MLLLLFSTPVLGVLKEITEHIAPEGQVISGPVWELASRLVTLVLSFLTFLALYRLLPNTSVSLEDVWLGALLASLAFNGAMWAVVWYLTNFPIYNVVYGSVGAVMALLTWVYVSSIILLFGAHVTSRYAQYTARVQDVGGIRIVWTGLSRVRLRVVESTEAG